MDTNTQKIGSNIKVCPLCKEEREFSRNKRGKDGLAFYCKMCSRIKQTASKKRKEDLENGFVESLALYWKLGVDPADRKPIRKMTLEEKANKMKRLARYGLTLESFDRLMKKQEYACAVCMERFPDNSGQRIQIDHDHKTGEVRGLLCMSCNVGLGFFKDSRVRLLRAVEYLRMTNTPINLNEEGLDIPLQV